MRSRIFQGKYGPMLIAEIGGNHEGNFAYAKTLTKLAISTGVDAIKFQLYTGDTLVSRMESPQRNEHFKKFELSKQQHLELARMVQDSGIKYMASVWDIDHFEWIDPFIPIYKIGSGDLTAYPMIRKIAAKGKPTILSTGLSTELEVLETIKFIQSCNPIYKSPEKLAILQCTSMYPIQHSDANLAVITKYKEITELTIGYSDHTIGTKAMLYAYALGAEIFEFHFTDTREGKHFRDHKVSLTPTEVKGFQEELILVKQLLGSPEKKPLPVEIENGHDISFRRSVYPARDLPAGTKLSESDLICLRPNHGIDARDFDKMIGKITKVDLKTHQKIEWDYLAD
jgi:N,N'-diacetyllegionaminate synthase